jgi:HK97 family phage portal protein
MSKTSKVHKISVTRTNTKGSSASQQAEKEKNQYFVSPPIGFDALIMSYESSFMLWGIVERIATSAGVGFKPTENAELDAMLASIDIEEMVKSFLVTGNFFFEMAFSLGGKLALFPFITKEVKLKPDYTLIQEAGGTQVAFEKWTYIQIKRGSLSSRYWGESLIGRCVSQIILLQNIDKFYGKLFERGLLQAFILTDKSGVMSKEDRDAVDAIIKDVFSGADNAFNSWVIGADLQRVDLTSGVDNQYFVELRREAKKDIAIALNFPYDLLDSQNSNRSIAEVSLENLNIFITKPNLTRIANQLKEPLRKYFGPSVNKIAFNDIDVSNQKEEMEVDTGYVREGVKTPNEVREKLGLAPHDDGNTLGSRPVTPEDLQNGIKQNISASLQKMYNEMQSK